MLDLQCEVQTKNSKLAVGKMTEWFVVELTDWPTE